MRSRSKLQIFKDLIVYLESKEKISLTKFAKDNKLSNKSALEYIELFNYLAGYLKSNTRIKVVKLKLENYEIKAVYLEKN